MPNAIGSSHETKPVTYDLSEPGARNRISHVAGIIGDTVAELKRLAP